MNSPLFAEPLSVYIELNHALAMAELCSPDDVNQTFNALIGGGLTDEELLEARNFVSSYAFALTKDTPAKRWFDATADRAPVYRALRIDPSDPAAVYAAAPFRHMVIEGQHRIAVAHPCPAMLAPLDDHLVINHVIVWNPVNDTVSPFGQDEGDNLLFGNLTAPDRDDDDKPGLYSTPRLFFQHWAMRRAQWLTMRNRCLNERWHVTPSECDQAPGSLVVGDLAKALAGERLPPLFDCIGVDPREVNRIILRSANLPRAFASNSYAKAV